MTHKPEDYVSTIPTPAEVPAGRVVVHNPVTRDIRPRRRPGYRGFRVWLQPLDPAELEACPCVWAPELGTHYRVSAIPERR